MNEKKRLSLAVQIMIALFLGILAGIIFIFADCPQVATDYIKPFGTIFLNLLKFIVVPVVLFSIMCGIISMKDIRKVGAIGWKTIVYYMCTTAGAVIIGLILSVALKGMYSQIDVSKLTYEAPAGQSLMDTIVNIFPSNALSPLVSATMLQVIVISLLIGFGIILAGEKGKATAELVESFNEVCMRVMDLILKLSPIGVFCLITPVVAVNGPEILKDLAAVLLVAYLGYAVHSIVVYSLTVKTLGGVSPLKFFKGMAPAMALAFSSASSVGTLPLNMECAQKLGARKEVASFVLPLGATINMDGTAIYQGVCTVFIATMFGQELTMAQLLTVVLTATLASIGTAGVPGAGMVMLTMVLQSVNLPIEGIALVAGVDRIFDMGRTVVNITGDTACAVVVSNLESKKAAKE